MNHPLATLCEQFLRERKFLRNITPSTLVWYQVAFKNFQATFPSEATLPTKTTLQNFVIGLRERGIRPVTCNTYIAAINAFCCWLHEEGHLAEKLRLKKVRVEQRVLPLLNDTQLRHLLAFRPKTFRQHRTHTAVCLVLDTGLRVSEMLNLKQVDVDFENLVLKVFGKGRKERLVPFSPELRRRLFRYEKHKTQKGIRSELVFAGFDGTRWEKRNSTTSLYLLEDNVGLSRFGWGTASANAFDSSTTTFSSLSLPFS